MKAHRYYTTDEPEPAMLWRFNKAEAHATPNEPDRWEKAISHRKDLKSISEADARRLFPKAFTTTTGA